MAYAGETPWHGLGNRVADNLTPEEMLVAAGLDWQVLRASMMAKHGDDIIETDEFGVLIRDVDGKILGPCGRSYVPVQNRDVFKFFDKFVKAGDMSMNTAGSLDGGRQVWGLANIRQGFTLPGGDEVQGHLLISHPHQWGKSLTIMFTPIRVVCNNTLTMALGIDGQRFRMPHVREFDMDVQQAAEEALGLATAQLVEFEDTSNRLAQAQYHEDDFKKFLCQVFQPTLPVEDVTDMTKWNRTVNNVHQLVGTQPGADMSAGSWWSALNAVTYFVDHKAGRDRDSSLKSAWFGPRSALKRRALDLATEYAEAA
jgi:phage/plasmid-like protein (TIGR03299 family)